MGLLRLVPSEAKESPSLAMTGKVPVGVSPFRSFYSSLLTGLNPSLIEDRNNEKSHQAYYPA